MISWFIWSICHHLHRPHVPKIYPKIHWLIYDHNKTHFMRYMRILLGTYQTLKLILRVWYFANPIKKLYLVIPMHNCIVNCFFFQARRHLVYIRAHKHIPELAPVGTGWHRLNALYHALRHCLCGPPEKMHHRFCWLVACHNVIYKISVVLRYTQDILHNNKSLYKKILLYATVFALESGSHFQWSDSLRVCYEAPSLWVCLTGVVCPTAQPRVSINLSTGTFSIIWYSC